MTRVAGYCSVVAAIVLASGLAIATGTPPEPKQTDDGPSWLRDWTELLPDFTEPIRDCVMAARTMPGFEETSWIRRLAPMNHGMGLVALQSPDGEIVECVAELSSGVVDRIEVSQDPSWARESDIQIYIVLPPVVADACGPPEPLFEGADLVGWRVDLGC